MPIPKRKSSIRVRNGFGKLDTVYGACYVLWPAITAVIPSVREVVCAGTTYELTVKGMEDLLAFMDFV